MISEKLQQIRDIRFSPLDLLPQQDLREKILDLVLRGVPAGTYSAAKAHLQSFRQELMAANVENVKVVVFGGGTGLSNIIGGDSRLASWVQKPFVGLKEIFPQTRSVVCITDNGGSTGELLKDLPIVAIGDMRHVLLSSVQLANLQRKYHIDRIEAIEVASILSDIFNWRFKGPLERNRPDFLKIKAKLSKLPNPFQQFLKSLFNYLFSDQRLAATLQRSHCFGNLLLAAAIYREIDQGISNIDLASNQKLLHKALLGGLSAISQAIGAGERAVLPCTSTPAQLKVLYTNGVEITGEHKLGNAKRGFPVESVQVDYCDSVRIYDEVLEDIRDADIVILAPGSLYSSIIPVFKVPGLADAVRNNRKALKILVSNLWVQAGETDLSIADPERKFHVSDMIRAYEKNISGGIKGLFNEVLCISLKDIPASVLQRYAVEGKIPIFLDKDQLPGQSYIPVECGVYSLDALAERGVIQHDPDTLALAIKGLYNGRSCFCDALEGSQKRNDPLPTTYTPQESSHIQPSQRYIGIMERLDNLQISFIGGTDHIEEDVLRTTLGDIFLDHPVIPLSHLDYFAGLHCIDQKHWDRDQQWDNVFSFFDPDDKYIKIRGDQIAIRQKLEVALMIAMGESLLGDYAKKKIMKKIEIDQLSLGRVYHLFLREKKERVCYFSHKQLCTFLSLARMCSTDDENHYTRLVNNGEGFTPPGLLMGLMYAWYIDNRFATHIEYKMSVMKINQTDLIPEQLKMADRRRKMIGFFKEVVFR
ncbi:MAG: YvcK family protein [Desulfobulbaceae bacterium]|nr:YvcK family protein [Desulfobulbaceae bacterium]